MKCMITTFNGRDEHEVSLENMKVIDDEDIVRVLIDGKELFSIHVNDILNEGKISCLSRKADDEMFKTSGGYRLEEANLEYDGNYIHAIYKYYPPIKEG